MDFGRPETASSGFKPAIRQHCEFTKEHTELLVGDEVHGLPLEYVLAYGTGGFWNLMMTWADSGAVLSPDEMASVVSRI